jgi:hypothetical protein
LTKRFLTEKRFTKHLTGHGQFPVVGKIVGKRIFNGLKLELLNKYNLLEM